VHLPVEKLKKVLYLIMEKYFVNHLPLVFFLTPITSGIRFIKAKGKSKKLT